MKAEQVSFAAGEISPVLHARTDLAKYHTALAELVNMIVLPQGGITRRAGFSRIDKTLNNMNTSYTVKLIPFEYNSTDSELLEFGDKEIRVWQKTSAGYVEACSVTSPYALSDVKDLRYVQSGNVMFLAHRKYKPQMLRRDSLTSWSIEELPFKNGPWVSGEEWASGVKLSLDGSGNRRIITSIDGETFSPELVGSLLKIEYSVAAKMIELSPYLIENTFLSETSTNPFEVKGTLNVTTSGDWQGLITIDRSSDGGETWVTVRQYRRIDEETQGQWDFTISETEENILYRVKTSDGKKVSSSSIDNNGVIINGGTSGDDGVKLIYLEGWLASHDDGRYYGQSADGSIKYYRSPSTNETFCVIGADEVLGEDYEWAYGYVMEGIPGPVDENGIVINEEEGDGE